MGNKTPPGGGSEVLQADEYIYIDIYINKGIVAVDCTESQLLL